MKRTLTIEYGDELLSNLSLSPEEFSEEAKFLLAAKLYELGKLSSGQAARFCGKKRIEFLNLLAKAGIPGSNLRPEDGDADVNFGTNG